MAGVLDRLRIKRTHFVGSSLGAMAGMALAFNHRDHLSSLTFMASQGALPPERIVTARESLAQRRASNAIPNTTFADQTEAMLARLLGDIDEATETETFALLRQILGETTLFGQKRAYEAIFGMNYDTRLTEITTPTLVLAATADSSTPPECMQMYADGIVGALMVILKKAGQFPNVEIPEAFNPALTAFLNGLTD